MKFFITIGGCAGFALAFASSLHAGNSPTHSLSVGSIGCCVGALLLRAAHWAYFTSLNSHLHERAATMEAAAAAAIAAAASEGQKA